MTVTKVCKRGDCLMRGKKVKTDLADCLVCDTPLSDWESSLQDLLDDFMGGDMGDLGFPFGRGGAA